MRVFYDRNGRPHCIITPAISFSLSHTPTLSSRPRPRTLHAACSFAVRTRAARKLARCLTCRLAALPLSHSMLLHSAVPLALPSHLPPCDAAAASASVGMQRPGDQTEKKWNAERCLGSAGMRKKKRTLVDEPAGPPVIDLSRIKLENQMETLRALEISKD